MKLEVTVDTTPLKEIGELGSPLRDAADAAVERQTEETKGQMRVEIARRLGSRAANALRSRLYLGRQQEVVGFIHSKWWKKRADGELIDMFAAFERGAEITGSRGQNIAIPLAAAYNILGMSATRGSGRSRQKAVTPEAVERRLGAKLFVLRRRGRLDLLCARAGWLGALSAGVASRSRRKRGRPSTVGTAANSPITCFALTKTNRLPKRLEFGPILQRADARLVEKFVVELARRDVLG